jgi:phosphate starvation-inducible PhoH-like protein
LKKIIKIKDIDSMYFAGPSDKNIKFIETKFKSTIVLRGNKLLVNGSKKEIQVLQRLVIDMLNAIIRKGSVSTSDIEILLQSQSEDANNKDEAPIDERIVLHTHKDPVYAKTKGQRKYYKAVLDNDIVFAVGPAGTGKTYQAVACAVSALKNKEVDRIVVTCPVVEAGENLGFLPGDLKEKVDPYLTPLYDALNNMIPPDKLRKYMDNKQIEIAPLAYMRGRTLHNSFIILDEAQNSTQIQMQMFLTRIGVTSKSIITGDVTQIDLGGETISGLVHAISILRNIKGIEFVYFDENDVVRHQLVKDIIKAYSKKEAIK